MSKRNLVFILVATSIFVSVAYSSYLEVEKLLSDCISINYALENSIEDQEICN